MKWASCSGARCASCSRIERHLARASVPARAQPVEALSFLDEQEGRSSDRRGVSGLGASPDLTRGAAAAPLIPLSRAADRALARLARATGSRAIAALDGATLLGERAALAGSRIPGRVSAGGGCRLIAARDDAIALNLARPADRELLPALFEDGSLDPADDAAITTRVADIDAASLVARGRMMGLAMAGVHEDHPAPATYHVELAAGRSSPTLRPSRPRVLDLSALWAGPLAAHLLWLAGCEVIKVESPARADMIRASQPDFHALLNQGKASVALDPRDRADRAALLSLIAGADIVVEAARPRALEQLGIDAAGLATTIPGLVWITITAYGAVGEAANWVGFGDDVGVAAGLGAAMLAATGALGFVGDAIADPLTGIHAAIVAWEALRSRRGGRFGVAMRDVAAISLGEDRARDPAAFERTLRWWSANAGARFPSVARRRASPLPAFGSGRPAWPARC